MTPASASRSRRSLVFALAAGMSLGLACGGTSNAPDTTHQFTVTEEDGITVARTTGGPKYEGEIFDYEKVLEIRPDESRPETLFFLIAEMTIDEAGNLYVVDANGNRISVFDAAGNWLRDIGRQGDGPGEFQFPVYIDYVDRRVLVPDRRRRGTHVFTPEGEFIELLHWPEFLRRGELSPQTWPSPGGGFVVHTMATSWIVDRLEERPGSDVVTQRTEMLIFDKQGNETARVEGPWIRTSEFRTYTRDGRESRAQVPVYFAARTWGGYVRGRGVWLSSGEQPVIEWFDLAGVPRERWEIDLPAIPVTGADRASVQEILDEQVQRAMNPSPEARTQSPERARLEADNALFADDKPFWGTPRADTFGYLWLPSRLPVGGLVAERLAERESERWSFRVLSPEGEYLGDTTPPTVGLMERGYLLATATDPETEESYPVVYRIRPAVDGLEYGR